MNNWLSNFFYLGKFFRKFATKERRPRRPGFRPRLELLEKRIVPVVAGTVVDVNPTPFDSADYSGVVAILGRNNAQQPYSMLGSGSLFQLRESANGLIDDVGQGFGHHILTDAHVLQGYSQFAVAFEFYRDGVRIPIGFEIPANGPNPASSFTFSHPNYVDAGVNTQNDIAVIKLVDQIAATSPSRLIVAPYFASGTQKYELYQGRDEVGQQVEFGGYGNGGTGNTGQDTTTGGIKRAGTNKIEMTGASARSEIQKITVNTANNNFWLGWPDDQWTGPIPVGATALQVQQALEGIPGFLGNVQVKQVDGQPNVYWVLFINGKAGMNIPVLESPDFLVTIEEALDGTTATAPNDTSLWFDFDNGLAANDALGLFFNLPDLGQGDSLPARGDSGGPIFIGTRYVGGIIQGGGWLTSAVASNPPDIDAVENFSFGEIGYATRVSSFVDNFVKPIVRPVDAMNQYQKYDVVLDMNYQVLGGSDPGEDVTIRATRNGANLELWVTAPNAPQFSGLYYSAPAANISSLTIRGSDDNETIIIEGNLGVGPIEVNAGNGTNEVHIGDPSIGGNLSDLSASVTVLAPDIVGAVTDLFVNDANATGNQTYTVTNGYVQRQGTPRINYGPVRFVQLDTGSGNDIVNVRSTGFALGGTFWDTPININTRDGFDTIIIGQANSVANILSLVTVDGGSGNNALFFDDSANPNPGSFRNSIPTAFTGGFGLIRSLMAMPGGPANPLVWRTLVAYGDLNPTINLPRNPAGGGGNVIRIGALAQPIPGVLSRVAAGDADDAIELDFAGSIDDASIQINAGLGNDSAVIQHGVIPTNQVSFVGLENLTVDGDAAMAGELVVGGSGLAANLGLVTYTQTSYGKLHLDLGTASASDRLTVSGGVTLAGMLDLFTLSGFGGNTYTLIDDLGSSPVVGIFDNLAEGTVITIGASTYSISYVGGDGNDVVLQRTGTIKGRAWHDVNADGIQDAGETNGMGLNVNLLDAFGNIRATTWTDCFGNYQFDNVAAGTYRVQFIWPGGAQYISPKDQTTDDLDSDISADTSGNGVTDYFALAIAGLNEHWDAGFQLPTMG